MNTPTPDPFDRALAGYSAREQARLIPPPAGFADRTTAAVLKRPCCPWKAVSASVLTGLVAVLAVGYLAWPKPQPALEPPQRAVISVEPSGSMDVPDSPNIGDQFSEAGNALAKLTRTTADKAAPRTLLPGDGVKVPDPRPMPAETQHGTEAIAAMPGAAKSGIEPMTGSTKRAISLFLRDTGLKAN
jgi:hypothetical protein